MEHNFNWLCRNLNGMLNLHKFFSLVEYLPLIMQNSFKLEFDSPSPSFWISLCKHDLPHVQNLTLFSAHTVCLLEVRPFLSTKMYLSMIWITCCLPSYNQDIMFEINRKWKIASFQAWAFYIDIHWNVQHNLVKWGRTMNTKSQSFN